MLLKQRLSLYRVFKITWKIDLIMLALCIAAYIIDTRLISYVHIPTALPTLMGTAIAFFIAFNNNQAYSRWWEARIIWGGIVNDSRSWARSLMAYCRSADNSPEVINHQSRMIHRHIAFLYALKASLNKTGDSEYKMHLPAGEQAEVGKSFNKPNSILDLQAYELQELTEKEIIDEFRFLTLNELLKNFCDGMGKSERINNTVFPTTYVYFTRLFIWILVVLVTMAISETIGMWSIFFGWVIGFVFHTTHINGMSIMDPFVVSPSCIPLSSITRNIEINVLQTLGEDILPEPRIPERGGEYIL